MTLPASVPIQGLTPASLLPLMPGATLSEARKVLSAAHKRHTALDAPIVIDGVRAASARALEGKVHLGALEVSSHQRSREDPFEKWLFSLDDGLQVETVRIPLEKEGRFSVCVSSQAGCAQGCTYCATGQLGLLRSLAAWEIVEQVRTVQMDLATAGEKQSRTRPRVHGVVFQGMGEPMANLDAVLAAVDILSEPGGCAVSQAGMTLSTVGSNPGGIRRLAVEAPKVRLALSIGAARPEVRQRIMPIERVHPLRTVVMDAAVEHALTTGLAPLWAVTPLAGVNDAREDAEALAELALEFKERTDIAPRISLVPYNAIGGDDPFQRVSDQLTGEFRDVMRDMGVFSHLRYSGGGDVGAACGQLAGASKAQGEQGEMTAASNWAGAWAVREEG